MQRRTNMTTTNICRCPCCHDTTSRVIIDGRCSVCGHVPGAAIEPTAVEVAASTQLTRTQKRRKDRYIRKEIEKKKRGAM